MNKEYKPTIELIVEELSHSELKERFYELNKKHQDLITFTDSYIFYTSDDLHKLGVELVKKQFEIYNPLRKAVVEVPEIVAAFDRIGIDIVDKIEF
jgi:hypothetical protein